MTVSDLIDKLNLDILCKGDLTKCIDGCYCSDLLSHCMSNIIANNLWITVQVNINIVAIAVLTELSAIIVAQDMEVGDSVLAKAMEENVTLLKSPLPAYELCKEIGKYI